jgi:SAM-dependent methyltransferase
MYQPLWGRPSTEPPLRECYDRAAMIHDAIYKRHSAGRIPSVLDLGCNEGFFSLGLCFGGFHVVGVDNHKPNIDLCMELTPPEWRRPRPDYLGSVEFVHGEIRDYLSALTDDRFTVTLGLSIFHHLCHADGFERTRGLLAAHAKRCPLLIVELALKSENEYWSAALPDDERDLLTGYSHVEKIGESRSHLGGMRPLYVATAKS